MFRRTWQASKAAARAKSSTRKLQRALALGKIGEWADQLHTFVANEDWRHLKSSRGTQYTDFSEYVCDDARYGLGLRDEKSAKLLKAALLMQGHVAEWLEILKRIARPKGRPRSTPAQGELFVPFYGVSESLAAVDRILLALADAGQVELLEKIGSKQLKAKTAAIAAGILSVDHSQGPACDINRIRAMSQRAQAKWAGRVFRAMSLEAQCDFLERELVPEGKDVAARWRSRREIGRRT